jgi:hypothetical protein
MAIYSVSVQNMDDSGFVELYVNQEGDILDSGFTSADYGIVSLSEECA